MESNIIVETTVNLPLTRTVTVQVPASQDPRLVPFIPFFQVAKVGMIVNINGLVGEIVATDKSRGRFGYSRITVSLYPTGVQKVFDWKTNVESCRFASIQEVVALVPRPEPDTSRTWGDAPPPEESDTAREIRNLVKRGSKRTEAQNQRLAELRASCAV